MSLTKGLVLHQTLSKESLQSATVLADKTPYENKGTIYGATFTTDRKGVADKAMSFDGVDDYVAVNNANSLENFYNGMTVSAWINFTEEPSGHNGYGYIVHKNINSNLGGAPFCLTAVYKKISFQMFNDTESVGAASILDYNDGNWHHIVGTFDENNIKLYIDGINVRSATSISYKSNNGYLSIGSSKYNPSMRPFNGSIDDVRIYNRALSEPEIKTLYESYNPCLKMTRALKGTFIDSRDGTEYKTIKIGNQTWMAENLKYLPSVVGSATGSTTDPYQYVYGYDGTDVATAKATTNYQTYGVLYNWVAATTACPAGWHLPSDEEFKTLEKYLGMADTELNLTGLRNSGDVGTKLKSGGFSNFEALMAGNCGISGFFGNLGSATYLWSSTPASDFAWRRRLNSDLAGVNRNASSKGFGLSVRCIRDY